MLIALLIIKTLKYGALKYEYNQLPLSNTPSWATLRVSDRFSKEPTIQRCCSKLSRGRHPALETLFEKTQRVSPTRELTACLMSELAYNAAKNSLSMVQYITGM